MSRKPLNRLSSAAAFAAVLLLLLTAGVGVAAQSGARQLISRTVDDVLVILRDPSLDTAGRRQRIESIAYERFDFETMSKLVVARYWKEFSAKQKAEFVEQFKAFLARTYGDRIERYSDEDVEIVGETAMKRGDVKVLTRIVGGEYDGAEVEYRVRDTSEGWRVIDVKVEGISLVLNYRDQFKSLLSRGGPNELLEKLKQKNTEA